MNYDFMSCILVKEAFVFGFPNMGHVLPLHPNLARIGIIFMRFFYIIMILMEEAWKNALLKNTRGEHGWLTLTLGRLALTVMLRSPNYLKLQR